MIALTLYDGKDTPIMVRGTHREAALQCEKIIREYRLVDGHVGVKGEGSCFNDLHATRNLMFYLANVMVEVHDEPNVEADYGELSPHYPAQEPIPLPRGRQLVTLQDAGCKITSRSVE